MLEPIISYSVPLADLRVLLIFSFIPLCLTEISIILLLYLIKDYQTSSSSILVICIVETFVS